MEVFFQNASSELLDPAYDHKDLFFLFIDVPYREAFKCMEQYNRRAYVLMNEQWKMPLFTTEFCLEVASSGYDMRDVIATLRFVEELSTTLKMQPKPAASLEELKETSEQLWRLYSQPLLEAYGNVTFPFHRLSLCYPWSYVRTLDKLMSLCHDFKTVSPLKWINGLLEGYTLCFVLQNRSKQRMMISLERMESPQDYAAIPHWHPQQIPNPAWFEEAITSIQFQGVNVYQGEGLREQKR